MFLITFLLDHVKGISKVLFEYSEQAGYSFMIQNDEVSSCRVRPVVCFVWLKKQLSKIPIYFIISNVQDVYISGCCGRLTGSSQQVVEEMNASMILA